jgi:hypothetical protein
VYVRQHGPLLIQFSTANPCEAWHCKLKAGAGPKKRQVATLGIFGTVLNIIQNVDNRAAIGASFFQTKFFSVCSKDYLEIMQFLALVQKLLATELQEMEDRIAEGKPAP